jgi:hypothetical protein
MRVLLLKFVGCSFVLLITAFASGAHAQDTFPYDKYDPRTVAELVQAGAASVALDKNTANVHMMLDAKPFYSAIRLKYMGTSRPVPAERKQVIRAYQDSMRPSVDIPSLIDNEYLFRECETEYWIPVQKQVAAYFPKELKPGDMITVYLMVIGGIKLSPKDPYQAVFLISEFKKYE